jgi:MscS family membrane protein
VIFFNRPFFTGDLVKTSSVTGTVELIGLRSTRIRTADTTLVTVPNKQMVDGIVDNWSMRKKRRGEMLLQLDTKTTAAQMKHLLEDIRQLLSTEQNPLITQADVHFREFSKEGQLIAAEFFTEPIPMTEFWKLKESIHLAIREQIETRGVDFAGEENTIRVKGEEPS